MCARIPKIRKWKWWKTSMSATHRSLSFIVHDKIQNETRCGTIFFLFSLWKEELAFLFGCLSRVLSLRVHLFAQCSWMGCHWRKSFDFIGIAATAALFSSFLVCFFIFIVYFGCRLFLALLNWCSYSVLLSGEHRRHTHWLNAVFGAKKKKKEKVIKMTRWNVNGCTHSETVDRFKVGRIFIFNCNSNARVNIRCIHGRQISYCHFVSVFVI